MMSTLRETPFLHVLVSDVFPVEWLASVQSDASRAWSWARCEGSGYAFWALNAYQTTVPNLNAEVALRDCGGLTCKYFYEVQPTPCIDIFRFDHGDGIGLHDDSNVEAIRIAVFISRSRRLDEGGGLLVLGDCELNTLIYLPTCNSGVGFATGKGNNHAVINVSGDSLLMAIAQFSRVSK